LAHEDVNFWCQHDLSVPNASKAKIFSLLDHFKVPYSVMIEDLQKLVDVEAAHIQATRENEAANGRHWGTATATAADPFFNDYHDWDDINSWEDQIASQYASLVDLKIVGTSYEGRPIRVMKVTAPANKGTQSKPVIYWEGGIHAREWISHATMLYMVSKLVTLYSSNDATTVKLMNSYEIHIVPVVNPDGYVWTWTNDREWRKTRKPNTGSPCIGTDPNRNWDDHWCEQGASTNPCSDSYCGSKAFSEPEVLAMAQYVNATNKAQKVLQFIDYHSYSQLYMAPYGWSPLPPPDATQQQTLGQGSCNAIKAVNGLTYEYGRIYEIIYPASGSSADWGYDVAGVKYSYGIELRDTGEYGFLLPADQIVPQGEEIWASLLYVGNYFYTNN
jgi:murein tripeptide amidase MpaA